MVLFMSTDIVQTLFARYRKGCGWLGVIVKSAMPLTALLGREESPEIVQIDWTKSKTD